MTKFFFDEGPSAGKQPGAQVETFFSTLKETGVIREPLEETLEAKPTEVLAAMSKLESNIVSVEYGTYQDNYAIHITPINPKRNLATDDDVKRALLSIVTIMNEYVPYNIRVDLHLPKSEWKMKVISAVVVGGASAWNFDHATFSEKAIPRIKSAVESVILGGP